jgi:surface antigen
VAAALLTSRVGLAAAATDLLEILTRVRALPAGSAPLPRGRYDTLAAIRQGRLIYPLVAYRSRGVGASLLAQRTPTPQQGKEDSVMRHTSTSFIRTIAVLASLLVVAAGGSVSAAGAAVYQVVGTGGTLHVHTAPGLGAPIVGNLPDGTTIDIVCQTTSDPVVGSNVWDRIDSPQVGYVADWYTTTPVVGAFTPGIGVCGSPPTPMPTSNRKIGQLTSGNYYPWGQCTWGAEKRFAEFFHHYPQIGGDARHWGVDANARGWTVVARPEPNSVAVFQPGEAGAGRYGHVAWVRSTNGRQVTIEETNFRGLGVWDTRTVTPGANARYILAP